MFKNRIVGVAVAIALSVAGGSMILSPTNEAPASVTAVATVEPDPNPCNAVGAVCGTIRWASPTSWVTIEDAGHHATGIASIQVFTDHLQVNYGFTAVTVSSMQVTPDEAFTSANVRVGASVGLSYTALYFYMGTSTTPVNPALLTKANANIWITGWLNMQ